MQTESNVATLQCQTSKLRAIRKSGLIRQCTKFKFLTVPIDQAFDDIYLNFLLRAAPVECNPILGERYSLAIRGSDELSVFTHWVLLLCCNRKNMELQMPNGLFVILNIFPIIYEWASSYMTHKQVKSPYNKMDETIGRKKYRWRRSTSHH